MHIKGKNLKKVKSITLKSHAWKFEKMLIAKPDIMHCYLRHSEINQYLDYVSHRYPTFVKVHTLGRTYEGRNLKGIEIDWNCSKNLLHLATQQQENKFMRNKTGDSKNDAASVKVVNVSGKRRNFVFIEGGTHAREWISISVALNCIYQLTEKNLRHRDILEKLRFFIVPVVNPDGYEYTQKKNPRWRKNRRPVANSKYIGIDCNRNYDFHWDAGPSRVNRCTYKGEAPFSEPETQAMRSILHLLAPQMLFFLSLHSYAQSIMYPWGYSKDLPDVWENLQKLAIAGRNAIKNVTGRKYRCGSIAKLTKRLITGSIVDYAFGVVKAPLALVMELPSAEFGFQPPPEQIQALGNESWVGIREMCKCADKMAAEVAPPPPSSPPPSSPPISKTNQIIQSLIKVKEKKTNPLNKQHRGEGDAPKTTKRGSVRLKNARNNVNSS